MNNPKLLIYNSEVLFNIFNELRGFLNFTLISMKKEEFLNLSLNDSENYLILTKENLNISNQLIVNEYPIKFTKLLEKINTELLRKKFKKQSNIKVGNYIIDINSRQISLNDLCLKLTEKEVNTILYLSKKDVSITIDELQEKVWGYQIDLETHTVETHIHRLRKKLGEKFKDKDLIISTKNGYQIKKNKFAKELFSKI